MCDPLHMETLQSVLPSESRGENGGRESLYCGEADFSMSRSCFAVEREWERCGRLIEVSMEVGELGSLAEYKGKTVIVLFSVEQEILD